MYVPGTAGLAALYALLLGLGVWAGALNRRKLPAVPAAAHNQLILARREVGLFLGIFSLVATCIGASFVNGTADKIYSRGLAWCQIPIGYGFSLLFGALLFAKPMRKAEYTTMLEPFQQHYGARVAGLLFLPALWHDLFWCAAVFRALGSALGAVANIEPSIAVCATALLVAVYTTSGGLYSVLWTSVLQLLCIGVGLALASIYAALHPAVSFEIKLLAVDWLGEIRNDDLGEWLDYMLLAFFGGISSQGYYQRVLSIKSASYARTLSIGSMIGFLALTVPFAMIGAIALATEWPRVDFFNMTTWFRNSNSVLPIVLKFLTPQWVSFAGLGAIAAGTMALADSCMLSIGSLFSRNVYKSTMRPKASERELDWILRISIAVVSFISAGVALSVRSVHDLAHLGTELAYVVMFPQLLSVIHWPSLVDSYGCLAGYAASLAIRVCGGESKLGIPIFVEYPFYDLRSHEQKFPFRTAAMLGSIFAQLIVSFFTRNLLGEGYLPSCCDLLGVYTAGAKNPNGVVPSSSGAALIDCTMHDASPGHLSDAGTLSSSRTDYDASSTDTQLQQSCQQQRYETISVLYNESKPPISGGSSAAHKANQNLQGLHNLRESMSPKTPTATVSGRPGQAAHHYAQMIGSPVAPGQILGVKNLTLTPAHMGDCIQPSRIMSPTTPSIGTPYAKVPTTILTNGRLEGDKAGDRSNMELNLNLTDSTGIVKKNIKGVKLIGMEGGTLRRPSLQGTFSPTPSVEMVNIFDRRQSSGSFGPSSLSPIPGVEACKTHGTAAHGQVGAEHCRIKRGIVRHHSFNDTGDRALTTLARQPNYPSMPLRAEECRVSLQRKDCNQQYQQQQQQQQQQQHQKKSTISLMETGLRPDGMTTLRRDKSCRSAHHAAMTRYSSCLEGGMGHMLVSPTYSMYTSAVKSCSYFDDEAVSRF